MAGNPLEIVTKFTSDVSGLSKGADEAKSAISGIGPASILTGAAIVGAAAVAVGAIIDLTNAAAKDQEQQAELEQAYRNTGAATGDYVGAINEAIAAGVQKGFTDDQTRAALMSLISATHDAGKANEDLKTAQDIARFAGVDLATAADAVAKAQAGQATQLTRLLPGLEKGKTATDTLANAQKLAAGASDTYAESTKGQMDVASASFDELGKTIGEAFLPILQSLMPPLIQLITFLGELIKAILPPLSALFGVLGSILGTVFGAFGAVVGIVSRLVTQLITGLQPILRTITGVIDGVAGAIKGVVDWLANLVGSIADAIGAVGRFLDSLNPLKGLSLPSISLPFSASAGAAPSSTDAAGRSGASSGAQQGGTVIVNVYGGDPRRITEAVKSGYRRWIETEGFSATTREW